MESYAMVEKPFEDVGSIIRFPWARSLFDAHRDGDRGRVVRHWVRKYSANHIATSKIQKINLRYQNRDSFARLPRTRRAREREPSGRKAHRAQQRWRPQGAPSSTVSAAANDRSRALPRGRSALPFRGCCEGFARCAHMPGVHADALANPRNNGTHCHSP